MNPLWPRPARTVGPVFLAVVGAAVLGLAMTLPAIALPTLTLHGGQVYYTGGDVTIDFLRSDTVFRNTLILWSGPTAIDLSEAATNGRVTLREADLAAMGFFAGDELRFGIRVAETNQEFHLGPASRNADGLDHAYVRTTNSGVYVGWEDIFGGGDRDYNDTILRISGVSMSRVHAAPTSTKTPTVPEPTTSALLLVGVGLLAIAYRRR